MNTINIINDEIELNFALGIITLLYEKGLITLTESFKLRDDLKSRLQKSEESNVQQYND